MDSIKETYHASLDKLGGGDKIYEIPPASRLKDKQTDVAQYVVNLFEESRNYRDSAYLKTKDDRFGYGDPIAFWEDLAKLESGNHWDVWGRRVDDGENQWKQEFIDDEIGNQIRVRSAHINANWHDISISPNIEHITEICDQERKATNWGATIRGWQKRASIYGECCLQSVLDKTKNRDGLVREILWECSNVFKTPYSTGIEKNDGNWFMMIVSMVNDKQVERDFPDVDLTEVLSMDNLKMRAITINRIESARPFSFTKLYPKYDMYLDDETIEDVPYTDAETIIEHATLAEAGKIEVHRTDNHKKHMDAHANWLKEMDQQFPEGSRTPDESQHIDTLNELMQMHIEDHQKEQQRFMDRWDLEGKPGKRKKYPSGRHVIVIGGVLGKDVVSEYTAENLDWRDLFHILKNEDVPNRMDGRGDAEILWNTNKGLDASLSRQGDLSVTTNIPKQWFNEKDRDTILMDGLSNDPTKPGFYKNTPPVFRQSTPNAGNTEIYNALKQNASKSLGINKSVYGNSPTTQSSSRLAETLIKQSETIIMGETNMNMNDAIEKIISTRIKLWKLFYTEPRFWFINGRQQALTLSRLLMFQKVRDPQTGQENEQEIPSFEIAVRPNSNFPNKWETQVETLTAAKKEIDLPEAKVAIDLMVMDLFSERFPALSRNGDYFKLGQQFVLGAKVMQQQQQQKEEQQKISDSIRNKFRGQAIRAVTKEPAMQQLPAAAVPQPTNGAQAA